jgi:cytochrome c553
VAALGLGVVILVDVTTPWELGFSAFYIFPVLWLAWHRGAREGVAMALLAGLAWYLVDFTTGQPRSLEFYRVWDSLNHEAAFLLVAWAVGAFRREWAAQAALTARLNEALQEVRELRGLLPVCAWCHQIRDETGTWHPMEAFLASHTRASTTHGICPDCARRFAEQAPESGPGDQN